MKIKKIDIYKGYKITILLLTIFYIILATFVILEGRNKDIFSMIVCIVSVIAVIVSAIIGISAITKVSSIRILELNFETVDVGMKQLLDSIPTIFTDYTYINTYVYNLHDRCYYQIYMKDEIKWMRKFR